MTYFTGKGKNKLAPAKSRARKLAVSLAIINVLNIDNTVIFHLCCILHLKYMFMLHIKTEKLENMYVYI